ncbi:MAG: Phage shock protein [Pseudomonadota bacterium]|jgi:phage shock protein PspC (stress-responsive transcriptional regulator)
MERVITISLGGHLLHLEESAHQRLSAYLDQAARALANDPDREEITADLEASIAEKCGAPGRGTTPVRATELQRALDETGPVNGTRAEPPPAPTAEPARKGMQLEQITEGAHVSGVCLGLARYFDIDPSWVRLAALVALAASFGMALIGYVLLSFIIPYAPRTMPDTGKGLPNKWRHYVETRKAKWSGVTA